MIVLARTQTGDACCTVGVPYFHGEQHGRGDANYGISKNDGVLTALSGHPAAGCQLAGAHFVVGK